MTVWDVDEPRELEPGVGGDEPGDADERLVLHGGARYRRPAARCVASGVGRTAARRAHPSRVPRRLRAHRRQGRRAAVRRREAGRAARPDGGLRRREGGRSTACRRRGARGRRPGAARARPSPGSGGRRAGRGSPTPSAPWSCRCCSGPYVDEGGGAVAPPPSQTVSAASQLRSAVSRPSGALRSTPRSLLPGGRSPRARRSDTASYEPRSSRPWPVRLNRMFLLTPLFLGLRSPRRWPRGWRERSRAPARCLRCGRRLRRLEDLGLRYGHGLDQAELVHVAETAAPCRGSAGRRRESGRHEVVAEGVHLEQRRRLRRVAEVVGVTDPWSATGRRSARRRRGACLSCRRASRA